MNLKPIPLRDPEIVEAEAREWRRENIEKVPTTSLTSLTVRGVELTSRYNKAHKFEAMQLAVLARTSMAACIRSIWCDSKCTACYTVVLRCSTWDARLALPFAECLGDAFLNIQGGFDFINAEAATATPTTGFPLARIGRPRTKKLVGVVSEVSDPLSLSTRVYAHAPFVNDEVFGLCIVVDADGRSLTSLTRLTNAPLTAQPKTSPRGKKGRARPRPPRPEPRQTHPTARGILRGDRRREAARMIRVERHEEVRPGIWRYTVPGFGIEGRSRQPLLDACRQIRAILGDTSQRAGLFREGRTEADISCSVNNGALLTVEDGPQGIRFRQYREFHRDADDIAEAAE